MLQEDRNLYVDGFLWPILPPDITEKPHHVGLGGEYCLFAEAIEIALYIERSVRPGISDPPLLDALRKKWPEAVEATLPEAKRRDLVAQVAERDPVVRKPAMSIKRKSARVPVMA